MTALAATLLDIAATARPSFEVIEYTLPARWASALINGDTSGLDTEDEQALDRFIQREGNLHFVDCGESYFSGFCDAPGQLAGDMADYTAHVYPRIA